MITVNDRDRLEWREGLTLADVLRLMNWDFALIVASINGRHVPPGEYETTPVPDGARVLLLHVMHGG
jgi:thiamine biosynthesis protein ThiS